MNVGWNGVLVEDLVTDERSEQMSAQSISSAGGKIVVIVRYDLFPFVPIQQNVGSLVNTRDIASHLIDGRLVDNSTSSALQLFKDAPVLWTSKMGGRAQ